MIPSFGGGTSNIWITIIFCSGWCFQIFKLFSPFLPGVSWSNLTCAHFSGWVETQGSSARMWAPDPNVGPRHGKSRFISPIARGYLWAIIPKNPKVEHNKYNGYTYIRDTPVLVPWENHQLVFLFKDPQLSEHLWNRCLLSKALQKAKRTFASDPEHFQRKTCFSAGDAGVIPGDPTKTLDGQLYTCICATCIYIYICVTIYLFNITHMYIYIYVTVFFHIIVTYLLYIKTYVQHLIIYISYSRMSCVYVYIRNLVVKNQRSENHRSEWYHAFEVEFWGFLDLGVGFLGFGWVFFCCFLFFVVIPKAICQTNQPKNERIPGLEV